MRKSAFWIVLFLLAVGALAFRLPVLENRPFHGDEAVHAFKFLDLWKQGVYRYDPNEYHGPTLYYAALPSIWLHGRHTFAQTQETDYRLAIVVFGVALIPLLALLADGLGKRALLWAGLLTALSPAFVFYSRYYIQEMLLACFTLGMLGCGWRYARSGRAGWIVGAGVFGGLMVATKETAVLTFAALAVALGITAVWTRWVDGRPLSLRRLWNPAWTITALFTGLLVACLFLSGVMVMDGRFHGNPSGPLDYLRSYTPWLNRAHGTDIHRHPWNYYLQMLVWWHQARGPVWSEGLIVGLALVGAIAALLPARQSRLQASLPLVRFLAFYTLILTLAYSVIPYKTPWCVLSFLQGMILLAGVGAMALFHYLPGKALRAALVLLLLLGCAQLGWQSYQTSYVAYADERNPYVYAQPVPDIAELEKEVATLAQVDPQHDQMVIKVFWVDDYYWPIPWYLRRFPNIGYYVGAPRDAQEAADAPVVLAAQDYDDVLADKLKTHHWYNYRGLRPNVFVAVWVRQDLWQAYLETRKSRKPGED